MVSASSKADRLNREISQAVSALAEAREISRARKSRLSAERFPSGDEIAKAVEHLSAVLFPKRLGRFRGPGDAENHFVERHIGQALDILREQIASELEYWEAEAAQKFDPEQVETILLHFVATLPEIRALIESDVEAAFLADPAARSTDEILICYPGALATLHHRLAHRLHGLGAPLVARIMSELANARTGIDIHPGATIGPSFFIDHGTGVVIGETAIVGARVRLYQHVTLGARAPQGAMRLTPRERFSRHPIIEDDVVVYAGATILGRVTIGRGSTIGGNVWLMDDVPAGSTVLQPAAETLSPQRAAHVRDALETSWA
jgi:serine O-acetyltransferase